MDTFMNKSNLSLLTAENPEKILDNISVLLQNKGELRCMLYSKYSFKLFDFMHLENIWDFSKSNEIIQKFAEAQVGCPKALTYTFQEIKSMLSLKKIKVNNTYGKIIFLNTTFHPTSKKNML